MTPLQRPHLPLPLHGIFIVIPAAFAASEINVPASTSALTPDGRNLTLTFFTVTPRNTQYTDDNTNLFLNEHSEL
jgi:hypothetical protein